MRLLQQILCCALPIFGLLGPAQSGEIALLPSAKLANATPALYAPYSKPEKRLHVTRRAASGTVIGATCSATACKTDDDCGSGCECGEDSKCDAGD
jgi:hypothetical protein